MKNYSTSQRVVGSHPPSETTEIVTAAGNPGPVPGRIRPLRPHEGALVHRGLRDARRGQFWHRRARDPKTGFDGGVEPGHTSRPRVGRSVRMLLSFQRPSRTSRRRGLLLRARPGPRRIPERTDEYSAEIVALGRAWRRRLRNRLRVGSLAGLGPASGHMGRRESPEALTGSPQRLRTGPGRSRSGCAAGRRNRSARSAATCPEPARRRRSGSSRTARSAPRAGARGSWCRG